VLEVVPAVRFPHQVTYRFAGPESFLSNATDSYHMVARVVRFEKYDFYATALF
jgi:hypothetical protein